MKFEEWMSTIGINAFRHANCCKIAYEAGQQSRQAEVDEQQKRIDKALRVLLDSSPTMISKKAIKILKGGDE